MPEMVLFSRSLQVISTSYFYILTYILLSYNYNILIYNSLSCSSSKNKSRKDNGSIRQKLQYSYFAKISEKYYGKFLFTKLNLGKTLEKQVT